MSSSENEAVKDVTDPFHKKYKVLGQVGEGSYSKVVKCRDRETAEVFACKRLKHCYRNWNQVTEINEIIVLRQLAKHTNILQFTDILFDPAIGRVSMVFELMEMNLYELIKDRKRLLPESRVRNIIFQLIRGLRHLHRHGIFHRDVKPENLLLRKVNGEDLLKIGDLGSVRGIISKMPSTEYISTRWYRSPECLLTSGYYGVKMDVWAVGCVFFEVLTLRPLFPGSSELDQINRIHAIMGGPPPRIMERFAKHAEEPREYNKHHKLARFEGVAKVLTEFGWSPSKSRNFDWNFTTITKEGTGLERLIPAHVSAEARDLIKTLLQYDPELRPTAHRAINHTYFNDLREAARRSKTDNDMDDEAEMMFDLNSDLPRLGDNKLKRSELGRAPNSGIKMEGSRGKTTQRLPIKLPKEVQSFSHRHQEKDMVTLPPKKVYSVDQNLTPKVETTISAFPPKRKDSARIHNVSDARLHPSPNLSLPYEKTYVMGQQQLGQKQYYSDLREISKKPRLGVNNAGNESTTKFVRQESDSASRVMDPRISQIPKRPEVEASTSRIAMKVSALQRAVGKPKVSSPQRDEHTAMVRKSHPDARVKKVMTTSMFPVLTESGSGRKHKGDASINQKSSDVYEKYMKDRHPQEFAKSGSNKGHQHLNTSVSDYKYIPKHQMSPHQQPLQRQVSGKRASKRLESKPSLHSITKSASQTKERRHHREEFVEPRVVTPTAAPVVDVVDKTKLSPEDLRRINENRRLVKLDPIGNSDVEIRKRYETLISQRASMKHSVQQREVEESDEDPHREIPHRVKRSRKVEEARRRPRPRRVEEVPQTEDDREKMDEDPWNKPFPVEELTQYHPNRPNPSSNTYRRHRDDKYSSGNYVMEKQQNQYTNVPAPNKQHSRHSIKPIGSSQRDSSELQAIYGKVEQRRSSHHIHKKPSASRAPLGNVQVQPSGQHYAAEYQNDRFSVYDQNKSYRTYRDGRQAKNVYNPEERHYMYENPRPRPVVPRRPSPRNELVYTPVMETKRSNGPLARPGMESKIPVRNFQPSISRIPPHLSTKRLEPYETQYNTSHYEKYRDRGYRDEGQRHIQRDVFSEKTQQKERQRKSQVFPPGRPGQQYQMEPSHISVAERLGLKPPKKPSASRIQHGGSIRTQQHYGERRRGLDD